MIRFESVSKHFGAVAAVDAVTLTCRGATLCALVGTSGSGKSTLLRLANRLLEADAGRILVDGTDIATLPPRSPAPAHGLCHSVRWTFPALTVARNVATVPTLLGWPAARIRDRVAELLALVGLPPSTMPPYRTNYLSPRWAAARRRRPRTGRSEVLLMDEPFGAVDPPTRRGLQDSLRDIQRRTGTTILLVTHDVEEAIRLGGTLAVLHQGGCCRPARRRRCWPTP